MINLLSSATATPVHAFDTNELIASLKYKLSPELINTISALGVERRYSTLENFPDFLRGEPMRATGSAADPRVRPPRAAASSGGPRPGAASHCSSPPQTRPRNCYPVSPPR